MGKLGTQLNLNTDTIGSIKIALPPYNEIEAIINYLEEQTAVINQFLTNKRRLIKLLEEQKQGVVQTAVTQGLNPNAPRKPSGINWLGDIPAHWNRLIFRRCISKIEQGWSPQCFNWKAKQDEWGVLKVGAVNGGVFKPEENKALPEELQPKPEYEIQAGDFLISRANSKELVGSASVVNQVRPKLLLCDKLYRVKLKLSLAIPYFMPYVFTVPFLRFQIERLASGSSDSMQNISQEKVKGLELVLPPIEEQYLIIEHIKEKTVEINTVIERTQREIELIEEYRTTLIAHAVTGKIDVSSARHGP